ncbi:MAG: pitrilysin family protein [Bacteroidetes bacterium]|nr:pitrilysin family protein [Bacteroidota bacterium]
MKQSIFIIALLYAFVSQAQKTQTAMTNPKAKLIQKVEKTAKDKDIVIPYQKYVLPNGLTLIVHEDHSDPIVHVDVTYHVGSAREEIGKSGFAHFFEHMMFQGSKNVKDEEHFKLVTQAGGTMNGTTNRDRTNYFETVPKNYLETALWLEADRMGFLLDSVTQRKFEVQRATVKNEKGQRYENRPYGMASEVSARHFYPFGHPYSWLTIGYVEDLNRVNVEDLKKFFLRWYGPNNAVLTVGGDVNTAEVVRLVEKYYGSMTQCPKVEKQVAPTFTIESDRYVSYEDNVRFPMLQMQFPTIPSFHPDEPALDILADILGGGKSSILYKNLVKTKKAVNAGCNHPTSELAGDLSFSITAYPDTKLADMEKMVRQAMEEFVTRGITDDDLKKAVAQHEASAIFGLESVSGKVSLLASYQTFNGDANMIGKDLARYRAVTKQDVIRVFEKYIKGKKCLLLSVYPKGKKEVIAAEDNHVAGVSAADSLKSQKHDPLYEKLTYVPIKDNFDRSIHPNTGVSPVANPPKSYTLTRPNGIRVIGVHNPEIPVVTMRMAVQYGGSLQPKGKEGVSMLMGKMLNESNAKYTAEQVSDELQKLGSSVFVMSGTTGSNLVINSLTKNLKQTMDIASAMVLQPKFDADEFERIKKQSIEALANQKTQATVMADDAFARLLYGEDHFLGTSSSGSVASLTSITLQDVKDYYQNYFAPNISYFVVSGDLTSAQTSSYLSVFDGWAKKEVKAPVASTNFPMIDKTRIYLLDKEKAPQSEIRIGYLAMPYDGTGEFFKAGCMNYVLGGAFNSRINLNLREDKGYTYGARSGFSGSKFIGFYQAGAGVRADATDKSVVEFMREIKGYADNGIKPEELDFTKKAILEKEALSYETNSQKAGYIGRMIEYGLPENYSEQQAKILRAMTVNDINALAKKHIPYNNMVILVVGDKKSNKPLLEKLGYDVVELDSDFKPVKN